MKPQVYKKFIDDVEELRKEEPSWPITFVLKDGTRLETLASESPGFDDGNFAIFVENEPHRGTAYFGIEDVICILT